MTALYAVSALSTMFDHDFARNAFLATALIAPACGLAGYFVVLRNEVFASDAMSHAAFTGSLAALAFGIDQRIGLFGATLAFGLAVGTLARRRQFRDVVIGNLFSWLLGLGVLFLAIFATHRSTGNSAAGPAVLFGSVFGITHDRAILAVALSAVVIVVVACIARPLLFSSLDSTVAASSGVRVHALGLALLVSTALIVAEAVQVVGALLVLGLIATPALTVQQFVTRPLVGFWVSGLLCLVEVWVGLTISYMWPHLPPSFVIVAIAFGVFLVAKGFRSRT